MSTICVRHCKNLWQRARRRVEKWEKGIPQVRWGGLRWVTQAKHFKPKDIWRGVRVAACADRCRVLVGGAIHCTTHRRQVRNLVSHAHGYAGCFTVGSTWRFHAIWARQEPHVVHQRTIRPYPKQQKDHNGRAQCSSIALSTTLSQDTGKTGGIMTGSPLRGGGVPPRGYHTNGRCGPTTRSPEELLHRSKAHTKLRARMVPACTARAYTDSGS